MTYCDNCHLPPCEVDGCLKKGDLEYVTGLGFLCGHCRVALLIGTNRLGQEDK